MEVRKADLYDEKELTKLRLEYLEEEKTLEDAMKCRLMNALPDYFQEHLNRDLFVFLACDKDKIAGTVFLQVAYKPNSVSFPNGRIGIVLNVYVRREYRRKGIAGRMIADMLQEAKSMKLDYIELKATKMGEGLYRKIGFEENKESYLSMRYVWREE